MVIYLLNDSDEISRFAGAGTGQRHRHVDPYPGVIAATIPLLPGERVLFADEQFLNEGQGGGDVIRVREILESSV